MKRLRYLTIAAVLSAVHLVLAIGSLLVSFTVGMGRFDSAGEQSRLESLASAISNTLFWVIPYLPTKELSPALQWAVVLGNSILWGAILGVPVWALARLTQGKRAAF
jgi:hypothetical protein